MNKWLANLKNWDRTDLIIVLGTGLLTLIYIITEAGNENDFYIYLSAAQDLAEEGNLYRNRYKIWYHYYYSPLFAVAIQPLSYLPFPVANAIWMGFNALLLVRIWKAITHFLRPERLTKTTQRWFTLICFLLVLRFIRDNIHLTQITLLILFLCLEGMMQLNKGNVWKGSFWIALGINIKIVPLVLLPYLIYRRQFKPALIILGFALVLLYLPAVVLGFEYNNFLLGAWWARINPGQEIHVLDADETTFHSLTTLVTVLFRNEQFNNFTLPYRRHIVHLEKEQIGMLIQLARLLFIGFTLYFLRSWPFRAIKDRIRTFWEFSYILLMIPLIFPHQQQYAFMFAFPGVSYLVYYLFVGKSEQWMHKNTFRGLVLALAFIFLTFNLGLIIGEFRNLYEHYKLVTWGALTLIIPLALCRPHRLEHEK